MQELRNFFFTDHLVRVVLVEGQPRFLAADLARVLGYRDAVNACRKLDSDEKGTHQVSTPGGKQEMLLVTEPGLYSLVLLSRRAEAKAFKKWVTTKVLPAIRKTGGYAPVVPLQTAAATDPVEALLSMSRIQALELALGIAKERDALKAQAQTQQATIALMEPKAQALDRLSNATGNLCITDAAKVLKMKPSALFKWLSEHTWTYRRPNGGAWIAYQDRIDGGWMVNKVSTITREGHPDRVVDRLLITPRGLAHLGQLLAKAS